MVAAEGGADPREVDVDVHDVEVGAGQVVGHQAFGVKDPHSGEPMDKDGLFRICSMTKAVTATAAMILWERGQLGLDDPVSLYLPEFEGIGVLDSLRKDSTGVHSASVRPITIRHLMTHTSGIPYGEIGEKRFAKLYAKYAPPATEASHWTSDRPWPSHSQLCEVVVHIQGVEHRLHKPDDMVALDLEGAQPTALPIL